MDILRYICKDPLWYQYTRLSKDEREIYIQLFHGIVRFEEKIQIVGVSFPADGAAEMIFKVWKRMIDDIPEFFYMDQCNVQSGFEVWVRPHYTCKGAEVVDILKKIRAKTKPFIRSIRHMRDLEKLRLIHDYLVANCTYGDTEQASSHRIDGAFLEGKPVCDGFSKAAQYLCDRVGIPCIKVRGHSRKENGPHAWNIVWIGGKPYHMDVTFDTSESRGTEPVRYDYFLLSDRQMDLDRIMDPELPVPVCPKSYRYYAHIGAYYRRQQLLEQQIVACAGQKKPFVFQLPAKLGGKPVDNEMVNELVRSAVKAENMAAAWSLEYNDLHAVYCVRFK